MSNSQLPTYQLSLPAGYLLKRYTIQNVLFHDDYSVTYLAIDTNQNTEVVLIEYLPCLISKRNQQSYNLDPKTAKYRQKYKWGLSSFIYKNYDLMTINHPNVINYEKCLKANNSAYMVTNNLSYKDGITLEGFIKGERLSEKEIKAFLTPLLDGLKLIHSRGYTHGNLTPLTIFIIDKISNPLITHLADVKYIFRYYKKQQVPVVAAGFSPCEQYYTHEELGAWSDIYSLGSILYWLISGVVPVSAASRLASIVDQQTDPLIPIALLILGTKETDVSENHRDKQVYSNQLLSAIDHAMELQGIDRPQSVGEWCNELGIKLLDIETIMPAKMVNKASIDKSIAQKTTRQSSVRSAASQRIINQHTVHQNIVTQNELASEEAERTRAYLEKNIMRKEVDSHAARELPFAVKRFKVKQKSLGTIASISLLFVLGFGGYYFFNQSTEKQGNIAKYQQARNKMGELEDQERAIKPQISSLVDQLEPANREDEGVNGVNAKSANPSSTEIAEPVNVTASYDLNLESSTEGAIASLTPLRLLDVPLVKEASDIISPVINSAAEYPVIATLLDVIDKINLFENDYDFINQSHIIKASNFVRTNKPLNRSRNKDIIRITINDLENKDTISRNGKSLLNKNSLKNSINNRHKKTKEDYIKEWYAKQNKNRMNNKKVQQASLKDKESRVDHVQGDKKSRQQVFQNKNTQKDIIQGNGFQDLKTTSLKQKKFERIQPRVLIKKKNNQLQKQKKKQIIRQIEQGVLEDTDW